MKEMKEMNEMEKRWKQEARTQKAKEPCYFSMKGIFFLGISDTYNIF